MPNPEEESFKELVENKFYCSRKFVEEIESIALENKDMKEAAMALLGREQRAE